MPTKKSGNPRPTMGSAIEESENFPTRAMIQAVNVVPRLAPMMTPMDSTRVRRPALTKLTTMTVVAEEDWIRLVVARPVRIAENLFFVIVAMTRRIPSPAVRWMASLITFMP